MIGEGEGKGGVREVACKSTVAACCCAPGEPAERRATRGTTPPLEAISSDT